jgi:hypothetical protein
VIIISQEGQIRKQILIVSARIANIEDLRGREPIRVIIYYFNASVLRQDMMLF